MTRTTTFHVIGINELVLFPQTFYVTQDDKNKYDIISI